MKVINYVFVLFLFTVMSCLTADALSASDVTDSDVTDVSLGTSLDQITKPDEDQSRIAPKLVCSFLCAIPSDCSAFCGPTFTCIRRDDWWGECVRSLIRHRIAIQG